jgi:16S rRNA (cytosine967-C5)-methyltransferase
MIAPARKAAFELLLELKRKPELHSDILLYSKRVEALSPLDRNLATTLVMGVLRWQLVLQLRIREALTKSKGHLADAVQVSLELGTLQLLLLDRIPAHAAIFESVELVRQSGNPYAVGLANAVLRKLTQAPKLQEADASAAHPSWMVERWVAAYGSEAAAAICRYDQLPPPTTIRLTSPEAEPGLQLEPGSFVARAWRAAAGEVAGARAARVQDEGSQLIAELAGRGSNILDCCAAPGVSGAGHCHFGLLRGSGREDRHPGRAQSRRHDHCMRHQSSSAQSHAGPPGRAVGKDSLPRSRCHGVAVPE